METKDKNIGYDISERIKEIGKIPQTINIDTLERKQLRIDIANEMLENFSNPKYEKRIDIVIGGPGSGKSSAVAEPLSKKHSSVIIDSDFAKNRLPEYEGGLGAGRVHKESKDIFKLALIEAFKKGMNVTVAIVGKSLDSIRSISEIASKHGYSQHLHLCEVTPEVAVARSMQRFAETGRYVDPNYILNEVGNKPTQNYKLLKEMCLFESYSKVDNDVPYGQKPIVKEVFNPKTLDKSKFKEGTIKTSNKSQESKDKQKTIKRKTLKQVKSDVDKTNSESIRISNKKEVRLDR